MTLGCVVCVHVSRSLAFRARVFLTIHRYPNHPSPANSKNIRVAWPEVAAELGGSPDSWRMLLDRALDRVTRELGFEEEDDESH